MTNTNKEQEWEKEFEVMLDGAYNPDSEMIDKQTIKSFIRFRLSQQRAEIAKQIIDDIPDKWNGFKRII